MIVSFVIGAVLGMIDTVVETTRTIRGHQALEQAHESLRESEARQRLLVSELQHRVRNILAMILSVVRRTSETSSDLTEYSQHLEGRIASMAPSIDE